MLCPSACSVWHHVLAGGSILWPLIYLWPFALLQPCLPADSLSCYSSAAEHEVGVPAAKPFPSEPEGGGVAGAVRRVLGLSSAPAV